MYESKKTEFMFLKNLNRKFAFVVRIVDSFRISNQLIVKFIKHLHKMSSRYYSNNLKVF